MSCIDRQHFRQGEVASADLLHTHIGSMEMLSQYMFPGKMTSQFGSTGEKVNSASAVFVHSTTAFASLPALQLRSACRSLLDVRLHARLHQYLLQAPRPSSSCRRPQ